jgi:hypothetical protein
MAKCLIHPHLASPIEGVEPMIRRSYSPSLGGRG